MRHMHHWYYFRPFTADHLVVLLGLVGASVFLIRLGHQFDSTHPKVGGNAAARTVFGRWLVALMATAWFIGQFKQLQPGHFGWDTSLPLHVCDVVGFIAPLAMGLGSRPLRAILHFWGLGVSSLAFVVPVIHSGPAHLEYWAYFISHGAIVVAAIYDVAVRGYRPDWRDWQLAAVAGAAYVAMILPLDVVLHANYGYLGRTLAGRSAQVAAWGAWPSRVPRLLLSAWAVMASLVLPWTLLYKANGLLRAGAINNPDGSRNTAP